MRVLLDQYKFNDNTWADAFKLCANDKHPLTTEVVLLGGSVKYDFSGCEMPSDLWPVTSLAPCTITVGSKGDGKTYVGDESTKSTFGGNITFETKDSKGTPIKVTK